MIEHLYAVVHQREPIDDDELHLGAGSRNGLCGGAGKIEGDPGLPQGGRGSREKSQWQETDETANHISSSSQRMYLTGSNNND